MRITSKYQKLNHHHLQAKLKTASHRFALMVDNYSPDDTEAENGLLMVTGKVFVPGYTDATVTIVYPKRKRATDQSFYYITPTESTEDMSLAYSDDTFYPRFSECEQAVKDLPEVTVSQYFYDKGIIPDDPSTFTALTGIPLESDLVDDINEITGEDANYYTIGAEEKHRYVDEIIKHYTDYQNGDKITPYLDITSYFFNNGEPGYGYPEQEAEFMRNNTFVSLSDFYNSLTIILRQPTEHPELNTQDVSNSDDWVFTVTSTFTPEIMNFGFGYFDYNVHDYSDNYIIVLIHDITMAYMRSLYSSLDEWATLVTNGVLQPGSQATLSNDLKTEYYNVCGGGNPWTYKEFEFTIKTRDLEGFTPIEGLGNGVFHFVCTANDLLERSLSHFNNPTYLNENPDDNQLYLTDIPDEDGRVVFTHTNLYSTVYFASNNRGREIVFLHLPDTLMSGCLDTAPAWATLNYLKTQGQQLMNCLQETILTLNNDDENMPAVVDETTIDGNPNEGVDTSKDLMNRLTTNKGWEQQTSTTILTPRLGDAHGNLHFKLQFTCIDNTWSLSGIIVDCEATGGEVPLPLSDTQLNEDVTSEDIQYSLEKIAEKNENSLWADEFVKANSQEGWLDRYNTSRSYDRWIAIAAANFINNDLHDLNKVTPNMTGNPISLDTILSLGYFEEENSNNIEWIERVLQAFSLPHSLNIPSDYTIHYDKLSVENGEYRITFTTDDYNDTFLKVTLLENTSSDVFNMQRFPLWTDLFDKTPYADFTTILPGVGPYLTLLHLFNQPILEDPQILNNLQRIINNEFQLERDQRAAEAAQQKADQWLSQVTECMNQSQIFTQTKDNKWTRSTDPIVINGVDYSQQIVGEIIIHADQYREEIRIIPKLHPTLEADSIFQYYGSLVPEKLANALDKNGSLWGSAEKVNTLVGHDVLNGIMTSEQLTAVEENTNDVLPWLSNSSAQQIKALQNAAGWVQYCDKILNNEEIPSLDFIKQGLHGNILNMLRKNNISGTTGINDFLMSIGAIPLKRMEKGYYMSAAGGGPTPLIAYDVCKYYAMPVMVNGWDNIYCALTFTKQNGKPVCQLQDDYLYITREEWGGITFLQVAAADNAHFTTMGDTFDSLVTGAGIPDYNLLHFLQTQLSNGLEGSDVAVQTLEENKEDIDKYAR